MFDINSDDIARLSDADLRSLIGRLCEAEIKALGLPTSSVTWGGDQDAPDGGLDVSVTLSPGTIIEGFVPRPITGFQVKKPDMPPNKIRSEMCPAGKVRPVIQKLANQSGAYVIVSSMASTSELRLQKRRAAMAEAIKGIDHEDELELEFYDGTRIATWVRAHPGLVLWLREKVGRSLKGWQPYGAWVYAPDGERGEYLLDEQIRIKTGKKETEGGLHALEGIELIRDLLRTPGQIVRLVGLSGTGKTRLVQALFDDRVGQHNLDPALAVYADMSDDPDPMPRESASTLIADSTRAIMVVDNCPQELHWRLSDLCRRPGSSVSVITVEYDIREDQPEGTDVFRVEPSSDALIENLVKRRFPEVSAVDTRTVVRFSGGNARIAIALGETIRKNETIAGLADSDLLHRLIHQRNEPDPALLQVAQACSMVYSFQADDVSNGTAAELARLGALVTKQSGISNCA